MRRSGNPEVLDRAATWYENLTALRRGWHGEGRGVPGLTVVSVGSLRAGGVGKSPMARAVASALRALGRAPVILLRGHGGSDPGPRVVRPGDRAHEVGDEALEHAHSGAQVVIARERLEGARLARSLGADVAVLDDGFQHVKLARDLDVVMVCEGDLHASVLPAGPLREPRSALAHADVLATVERGPERFLGRPVEVCPVAPTGLLTRHGAWESLERWRGSRALLVTGIARPERVALGLERAGVRVVEHRAFRDHAPLPAGALSCGPEAALVLVTAKDAAREGGSLAGDERLRVIAVEAALSEGMLARLAGLGG